MTRKKRVDLANVDPLDYDALWELTKYAETKQMKKLRAIMPETWIEMLNTIKCENTKIVAACVVFWTFSPYCEQVEKSKLFRPWFSELLNKWTPAISDSVLDVPLADALHQIGMPLRLAREKIKPERGLVEKIMVSMPDADNLTQKPFENEGEEDDYDGGEEDDENPE